MRKLLYISFLFTLFLSCQHSKNNLIANTKIISDTISIEVITETKYDTIIKISEPFILNELSCYWKHYLIIADYGLSEIIMELKEDKTDKLLFQYSDYVKYEDDFNYKSDNYFDEINEKHFIDVNFDGYKDFIIRSYGSMPMTDRTNIYIFYKKIKTFDSQRDADGEYLSDTNIDEIDTINKILTTSSFSMELVFRRKHHFDNNGKIKFSEYFSEEFFYPNDTIEKRVTTYTKIINGKEVETKIDTTDFKQE
jgi:hypothetical protein